ncbi:hypothetical protein CC1G_07833 [Coprinopsis cinerea okayama7|uniref:DUF7918 domain-containing protein n=1 Tax=Coprinopsis cinerea (strain Okayama-7 / 130 / ATCC MYA-4618 / FGSC 9003) TaxID=240176 RepID=A8P3Z5_COPC7|nr:hypothetical protein CC1G_07833 [Coprinopsis cinerea okayama7\|eukprot:XP_001838642.2 hypothetical protein CC1G_07833 [Coprinopsis cinerea okayama7\
MPEVLGFRISVEMEGRELPEYKEEVDYSSGIPVATCWIPSEAGKTFQVNVRPPPVRSSHWSFVVSLDGMCAVMRNTLLFRDAPNDRLSLAEEVIGNGLSRTFKFSNIQLTDDDSMLNSRAADKIGEIGLSLSSVTGCIPIFNPRYSNLQAAGRMHEKSKKGLAHCVQPGEVRQTGQLSWYQTFGQQHEATILFKYRNLDILVAQGIAPRHALPEPNRQPSPPPRAPAAQRNASAGPSNPRKRKSSPIRIEIDIDEEIRLIEEEKELEARLAAIRAKKRAKTVKVAVKSEARSNFVPGEVIDLT